MTNENLRSFVRQCIPPIFLPVIKSRLEWFRKSKDSVQESTEELEALEKAFRRLNQGTQDNEIMFREHIDFFIHPDSRVPFEMFCFRSAEMVEEMNAFIVETKGKNCLLDVGALHGIFSLVFAAINRERRAVAIEPSPIAFAKLLYNIRKNGLQSNICSHEVALSSASGTLQMYYQWEHSIAAPLSEPGEMISVDKIPGDVLCNKLAFKPDVIKIDVEGHELKVINGLIQTIKFLKPLVFLEVHPELIRRENDNISDLCAVFENADYRAKQLNGEAINFGELRDLQVITRIILEPLQL
jgi:FkbM family methyltransferase